MKKLMATLAVTGTILITATAANAEPIYVIPSPACDTYVSHLMEKKSIATEYNKAINEWDTFSEYTDYATLSETIDDYQEYFDNVEPLIKSSKAECLQGRVN